MTKDALALDTLSELAPVALIYLDDRRKILDLNPFAEEVIKKSKRVAVGKSLNEVIYYDSPLFEVIDRTQPNSTQITATALSISGPQLDPGPTLDVRVIQNEDGKYLLTLTEPFHNKLLDQSSGVASVGRVLGHEVKNPLAGISGAAQLLSRQDVDGQAEMLSIILSETKRIERMINRITAFELFSSPQFETYNVHELLSNVVAAERVAAPIDVNFVERYDPSLPEGFGDADHIHEAIQNIIRNAVEALVSNKGAVNQITITTSYAAGFSLKVPQANGVHCPTMLITLTDTGGGIPKSEIRNIFDAFKSSKSAGRGLGLTIVQEIVKAHGGQLTVKAKNGETAFGLLLPLSRSEK